MLLQKQQQQQTEEGEGRRFREAERAERGQSSSNRAIYYVLPTISIGDAFAANKTPI